MTNTTHTKTNIHFASNREDWETPDALFQTLHAEFEFTLDAAASDHNAKLADYYTEEDDALTQPWPGTVWLNPPYGRQIGKWIEKAIQSTREGATVVLLVPARTDSIWFQHLAQHAQEIRFVAGRLTFVGASEPAPFPSAIVVLRPLAGRWPSNEPGTTFKLPTRHGSHPWTRMWTVS